VAGVRLASTDGFGWTVETVDLEATGRRRGTKRVSADPLGDGPQLLVCRWADWWLTVQAQPTCLDSAWTCRGWRSRLGGDSPADRFPGVATGGLSCVAALGRGESVR
jgi:hypothetical protein